MTTGVYLELQTFIKQVDFQFSNQGDTKKFLLDIVLVCIGSTNPRIKWTMKDFLQQMELDERKTLNR